MPAAAIPWIIGASAAGSAATSLYGAHKAADTAHDAAQMQIDASNKALDFQKQAYDTQRQDLAPYRGLSAALGPLMARAGRPIQRSGWGQYTAPGGDAPPMAMPTGGNQYGTLAGQAGPGMGASAPTVPTPSGPANPGMMPPGGPMVTMRAPNGMTKQVPEEQVEHFKSLGAQVVG